MRAAFAEPLRRAGGDVALNKQFANLIGHRIKRWHLLSSGLRLWHKIVFVIFGDGVGIDLCGRPEFVIDIAAIKKSAANLAIERGIRDSSRTSTFAEPLLATNFLNQPLARCLHFCRSRLGES